MSHSNTEFYGFTAVPRDPAVLFQDHPTASGDSPKQAHYDLSELSLPDSKIVREVKEFVKVSLMFSGPTY